MLINSQKLTTAITRAAPNQMRPDKIADQIAALQYGWLNEYELAAFIANTAHESAGYTVLEENLMYRAEGLVQVFGKYFRYPKEPSSAKIFASDSKGNALYFSRKPEEIANFAYADRNGNGDYASGDGYRYRGRGWIQLTGRRNYASVGMLIGQPLEDKPELAIDYAANVALAFWVSRGCNKFAKELSPYSGSTAFALICKKINGGEHGLDDRKSRYTKALTALLG